MLDDWQLSEPHKNRNAVIGGMTRVQTFTIILMRPINSRQNHLNMQKFLKVNHTSFYILTNYVASFEIFIGFIKLSVFIDYDGVISIKRETFANISVISNDIETE